MHKSLRHERKRPIGSNLWGITGLIGVTSTKQPFTENPIEINSMENHNTLDLMKEIHIASSALYSCTWKAMQPWWAERERNSQINRDVMAAMERLAELHTELKQAMESEAQP